MQSSSPLSCLSFHISLIYTTPHLQKYNRCSINNYYLTEIGQKLGHTAFTLLGSDLRKADEQSGGLYPVSHRQLNLSLEASGEINKLRMGSIPEENKPLNSFEKPSLKWYVPPGDGALAPGPLLAKFPLRSKVTLWTYRNIYPAMELIETWILSSQFLLLLGKYKETY